MLQNCSWDIYILETKTYSSFIAYAYLACQKTISYFVFFYEPAAKLCQNTEPFANNPSFSQGWYADTLDIKWEDIVIALNKLQRKNKLQFKHTDKAMPVETEEEQPKYLNAAKT